MIIYNSEMSTMLYTSIPVVATHVPFLMEKEQVCPRESSVQDVISLNSDYILT